MYTQHPEEQYFLEREEIYEWLEKENEYAKGWGDDGYKPSDHPIYPNHTVSHITGQPFSLIEWLNFTQKYIDEARQAEQNYCPDQKAVRIRVLKAASLLVTALQVHGELTDINTIAGVSSTIFPLRSGGLKEMQDELAGTT